MNIDEIAKKVWNEVSKSSTVGERISVKFAHALLAELSKQEPFCWYSLRGGHVTKDSQIGKIAWPSIGYQTIPLFTSPPNTAEIEQRPAEAILKFICHRGAIGPDGKLARDIAKGEWREYL